MIERYYLENHTRMGWRFAYGPKSSLGSDLSMWFIGANPGGSGPDKSEPSREDGNGYRLEGWSNRHTTNTLQRRVLRFFQMLGDSLNSPWEPLIDQCFISNACPLRTPSEAILNETAPHWRVFCIQLWTFLLKNTCPAVIVCHGNVAYEIIRSAADKAGFVCRYHKQQPTGCGDTSWIECELFLTLKSFQYFEYHIFRDLQFLQLALTKVRQMRSFGVYLRG